MIKNKIFSQNWKIPLSQKQIHSHCCCCSIDLIPDHDICQWWVVQFEPIRNGNKLTIELSPINTKKQAKKWKSPQKEWDTLDLERPLPLPRLARESCTEKINKTAISNTTPLNFIMING